jgi:predicted alpha/beta-fold hydrolase
MASAFLRAGYDVLAWNYRGCGDDLNRKPRFYHSGATDDLESLVQHVLNSNDYDTINLIGFSLGGNIVLKFLGEQSALVKHIDKAIAISVPLDLDTSCAMISKRENRIYAQRFLKSLKQKIRAKSKLMALPNLDKLSGIDTIREFDEWITGPLHGFRDAQDYYSKCSSINFLPYIKTPTLIINARNDPFLSPECFPEGISSGYLRFLYPEHGGHVGFTLFNKKNLYWSEIMALKFIADLKDN